MKALLLAAGKGTRLGELTKDTPKCLLKVGGVTMLDFWIEKLRKVGVTHILINSHHHWEKIYHHVSNKYGSKHSPQSGNIKNIVYDHDKKLIITMTVEKKLLGSFGTLYANKDYFKDDYSYVIYSDVWTNFDLKKLYKAQFHSKKSITLGLCPYENKKQVGIVTVDYKEVKTFNEKPDTICNVGYFSGIAMFHSRLLTDPYFCWRPSPCDLSRCFFQNSMGVLDYHFLDEPIIDIGAPQGLEQAREEAGK